MFKSKRKIIEELKAELTEKDSVLGAVQANFLKKEEELRKSEVEITSLKNRLNDYMGLDEGTPSDCKRGKWCAGCEFAKSIMVPVGFHARSEVYFCGKGESCQNFVQRKKE